MEPIEPVDYTVTIEYLGNQDGATLTTHEIKVKIGELLEEAGIDAQNVIVERQ